MTKYNILYHDFRYGFLFIYSDRLDGKISYFDDRVAQTQLRLRHALDMIGENKKGKQDII